MKINLMRLVSFSASRLGYRQYFLNTEVKGKMKSNYWKNINEKFDKSNRFDVSSHAAMNYSAQYSLYVNMFFKKVSHAIGP